MKLAEHLESAPVVKTHRSLTMQLIKAELSYKKPMGAREKSLESSKPLPDFDDIGLCAKFDIGYIFI